MVAFDVRLQSSEWLGAWKPDGGRVTVAVSSAPRLNDKVAVRIQLAKPSVRATVVGTVASFHRQDKHLRVELVLEPESLDAARMLAAVAQGQPVSFRPRAPRFLAKLPVLTSRGGTSFYLTTLSISQSGCSVRWSGTLPTMGEAVNLRFRGSRAVDMRGVVRWRNADSSTVGLRFVDRIAGADAWRGLLEEVKKSGAPPA